MLRQLQKLNNKGKKEENDKEKSEVSNNTEKNEKAFLKPLKTIGKIANIIIWTITVIILLLLLVTVASNKTDVFGHRLYLIMSGSMEPTIKIKDAIITRYEAEPKEGDIIAFENGNAITVHRITKVYTEGDNRLYQTKGDNNNAEDQGLVQKSQIKGTVKVIMPVLGQTIYFLQTHFIVLILAIGIVVIYIIVRRLL